MSDKELIEDLTNVVRSVIWEFRTFGRPLLGTFDKARAVLEKHNIDLGPQLVINGEPCELLNPFQLRGHYVDIVPGSGDQITELAQDTKS